MNRFFSKQAYRVTALEIRKRLAIELSRAIRVRTTQYSHSLIVSVRRTHLAIP